MQVSDKNLDNIKESTIDYLINQESKLISMVKDKLKTKDELFAKAKMIVKRNNTSLTEEQITSILAEIDSKIFSYGKLTALINDKSITDIKLIAPKNVRQKRKVGRNLLREKADVEFEDIREYEKFINLVATKNKSNLATINAEQVITDATTSEDFILRIAIGTNYITSVNNSYMHIRKLNKVKRGLKQLCEAEMFTTEEMEYIDKGAKKGLSFLVCGKGSAGKTTLINGIIEAIGHDKAGLVIQESEELFTETHPDFMFLKVRNKGVESDVEYTLKTHSVWGLKVDIDVFGIGEITGGEAYDFANACYTGYQVLGSLHAYNSLEALSKLVHYAKYSSDYEKSDLLEMFQGIDGIIFIDNFEILEITEIQGYDKEKKDMIYHPVFANHQRVADSCKKVLKKLEKV